MARVTVEDCLENVENRFQLVLISAKRARQLANGREASLVWENDKPTVMALREIAAGHVGPEILDEKPVVESPFGVDDDLLGAPTETPARDPFEVPPGATLDDFPPPPPREE